MSFLTSIMQRCHSWAQYVEQPSLLKLRRCKVPIHTYRKLSQPWLQELRVATVLDIGANVGQFALAAREAFPQATVYSFEPLPDCFEDLQRNLGGTGRCKAFNVGLGRRSGIVALERNAFTASSSFLPMNTTHKTEFPFTRDTTRVDVRIEKLDDFAHHLSIVDPMLVKIDVQGYEEEVLVGGETTIRGAVAVITETSFEPLYATQPLFDQIYRLLVSWGFAYMGSFEQVESCRDGRPLQSDSVFMKRPP